MKFRPCIDLHSGQVKQIVGSTLTDDDNNNNNNNKQKEQQHDGMKLATNFETDRPAGKFDLHTLRNFHEKIQNIFNKSLSFFNHHYDNLFFSHNSELCRNV